MDPEIPEWKASVELIQKELEVDLGGNFLTEEDLLILLSERVAWLLDHRMEWLFSLLYRMDVSEKKVHACLQPDAPEPAYLGIARLIMERQKARIRSKRDFKVDDLGDDYFNPPSNQ